MPVRSNYAFYAVNQHLIGTSAGQTACARKAGKHMKNEAAASRRYPRSKIFKQAALSLGGVTFRAHALNVSAGGALMHCADLPVTGDLLRVVIDGAVRNARVAWRGDKRFGVQFTSPLGDEELAELLSA